MLLRDETILPHLIRLIDAVPGWLAMGTDLARIIKYAGEVV